MQSREDKSPYQGIAAAIAQQSYSTYCDIKQPFKVYLI